MRKLLNTLYVTNPEAVLRKKDDALGVYLNGERVLSVPFHLLEGVVIFGHAGCSASVLRACASRGIGVALLDESGRFQARVTGRTSGNILLRKSQFAAALDEEKCLDVAKRFVMAKLHNSKIVLQHYGRDYERIKPDIEPAIRTIENEKDEAMSSQGLDELRGVEGDAAHAYFGAMGVIISAGKTGMEFSGRNRRPPRDPVNASLSMFYTLLAREVATACETVGLDPQMGYLHACRPGRMSLALDLVEEMRAPIVDRFVISLFNRGQLDSDDFKKEGESVFFKDEKFKQVIGIWQQKKQEQFMHPFLKERIPIGLLPMVQAQLFAKYIRGDINDYPACMWR